MIRLAAFAIHHSFVGRDRSSRAPRRFRTDERAVSALEFALIAPVFCMLLFGAVDFGGVLYVKFNLEGAVSAGANYALVNAASVSSSGGAGLAANLTSIVANDHSTAWADATAVVNNGPSSTVTSGAATSGGTAAAANSCYCPTKAGTGVTWGSVQTCGATCPGGGVAGKFVTIVASRTYTPMFSYGIVRNSVVSASATVETQ